MLIDVQGNKIVTYSYILQHKGEEVVGLTFCQSNWLPDFDSVSDVLRTSFLYLHE